MATILHVDDYEPVTMLVHDLLKYYGGHEVLIAADGVIGYEMALSHRPDLILIDLGMPRMDGYTLIWELLRTTLFRRVPIVILTAQACVADREWRRPFDLPYLTKPIHTRGLPRLVAWLLEWAESQPPPEPSDDPKTYPFYMSDELFTKAQNVYYP